MVELIWEHHLNDKDITIEYDGNSLIDDVAIGAFLGAIDYDSRKPDIKFINLPRIDLHEAEICSSKIDLNCHHYYFLHPKSPNCYYLMRAAIEESQRREAK